MRRVTRSSRKPTRISPRGHNSKVNIPEKKQNEEVQRNKPKAVKTCAETRKGERVSGGKPRKIRRRNPPRRKEKSNADNIMGIGNMQNVELQVDNRNPMTNQVVMRRFFELCGVAELKKFRLVSKLWYELSCKRYRSEMRVNLEGNKFLDLINVRKLYSEEYLEKPFDSYRLRGFIFNNEPAPARWSIVGNVMQRFWENCGPSIRYLELENCNFLDNTWETEEALRHILSATPNLEEMVVRGPCKWAFTTMNIIETLLSECESRPISKLRRVDMNVDHIIEVDPIIIRDPRGHIQPVRLDGIENGNFGWTLRYAILFSGTSIGADISFTKMG